MSPGGLCGRDRLEEQEEWGEAVGLGARWRSEDDHRCFGAAPGVSDADGRRFCWQRRHGSRCLRLLDGTDEYDVACRSRAQWGPGRSLRDQIFFLLRTALRDRPKGPPTANRQPPTVNRQPPPTVNRCQPPPTTHHQLPTAANRRQPSTANRRQPSTAANRHQPPITNCQLPPTAANRQPVISTSRQPPIATNHG